MTNWLDDTEMAAWRGLIEEMNHLMATLDAELADHDLTLGDYEVLVVLSEAPQRRLRMCDLATSLRLSPSGLTRRLDGLVGSGLVAREPSPDDGRVTLAVLMPAGVARLEEAAPTHVHGVRRHLLDHLNAAQIRQLGNAMAAVRRGRLAEATEHSA
jgi:DNA-binding MarR family transcriptional regulator